VVDHDLPEDPLEFSTGAPTGCPNAFVLDSVTALLRIGGDQA